MADSGIVADESPRIDQEIGQCGQTFRNHRRAGMTYAGEHFPFGGTNQEFGVHAMGFQPFENSEEPVDRPVFPGTAGTGVQENRSAPCSGTPDGARRILRRKSLRPEFVPKEIGHMDPMANRRSRENPTYRDFHNRANGAFGKFGANHQQYLMVLDELPKEADIVDPIPVQSAVSRALQRKTSVHDAQSNGQIPDSALAKQIDHLKILPKGVEKRKCDHHITEGARMHNQQTSFGHEVAHLREDRIEGREDREIRDKQKENRTMANV